MVPCPFCVMVSVYSFWVKVAVTDFSEFMMMFPGLALPVRSPLQWSNCQPTDVDGISCTVSPGLYLALFGFLVMEPVPSTFTVSVYWVPGGVEPSEVADPWMMISMNVPSIVTTLILRVIPGMYQKSISSSLVWPTGMGRSWPVVVGVP